MTIQKIVNETEPELAKVLLSARSNTLRGDLLNHIAEVDVDEQDDLMYFLINLISQIDCCDSDSEIEDLLIEYKESDKEIIKDVCEGFLEAIEEKYEVDEYYEEKYEEEKRAEEEYYAELRNKEKLDEDEEYDF